MEIYTINPTMLLASACAPNAAAVLPVHESVVMPAAERVLLPVAYQVQVQSELANDLLPITGSNGTSGFRGGMGDWSSTKRQRGVPPRGRPV